MCKISFSRATVLGIGAAALLLTGCASQPKPMYRWGSYQTNVYDYLKGDGKGPEEQIAALQLDMEKAKAKNLPLPPGFHAHLGLLYIKTGHNDQAVQELEAEKAQFPESGPYIDFLLKKINKA